MPHPSLTLQSVTVHICAIPQQIISRPVRTKFFLRRSECTQPTWLTEPVHPHTGTIIIIPKPSTHKKCVFSHSRGAGAYHQDITKTWGSEPVIIQSRRLAAPRPSTSTTSSLVLSGHAPTHGGTKRGCLGVWGYLCGGECKGAVSHFYCTRTRRYKLN